MSSEQEKFIKAYSERFGNVAASCRAARISRQTYYNWRENTPEFLQAILDADEEMKDTAESKLHELINGVTVENLKDDENPVYTKPPDFRAISYFLDRKARDRGYGEKVETENTNNNTITVTIDYGDATS